MMQAPVPVLAKVQLRQLLVVACQLQLHSRLQLQLHAQKLLLQLLQSKQLSARLRS